MSHAFDGSARFSANVLLSYLAMQGAVNFDRDSGAWHSLQEKVNGPRLTLVGSALNAHMVESILLALPQPISTHAIFCHHFTDAFGQSGIVIVLDHVVEHEWIVAQAARFHIDIFCQVSQPVLNQPGVLVMDMDSTVIQIECIDEIAKLAGRGEEVSAVTELAMQGKLDFAESLIKRVGCLQGVPVSALQQIRDGIPLMPGIVPLVNELKANGWTIALASGGFTYFADYVVARLTLDFAIANTLGEHDGVLTGEVIGEISSAQTKADTLQRLAAEQGIAQTQTMALGDGANDLVMMNAAHLGMAYKAKPIVQAQATCAICYSGLEASLFAFNCDDVTYDDD